MSFHVLDNGRPACFPDKPWLGWSTNVFETFEEAKEYAEAWLGDYSVMLPGNWDGSEVDYSGCGDLISIWKEERIVMLIDDRKDYPEEE